jgi:hypothetical protein
MPSVFSLECNFSPQRRKGAKETQRKANRMYGNGAAVARTSRTVVAVGKVRQSTPPTPSARPNVYPVSPNILPLYFSAFPLRLCVFAVSEFFFSI